MTDFKSLGLSAQTLKAIDLLGYEKPTPIQEKAIPAVLSGQDVIAGAQTGTGKTAAFCLPCLDKLPHMQKHCGPLMLIVTPTRELADQISEVCLQITKHSKHKVTTVVGGVSYTPQREALKRGTDILIATPGRLEDLINQDDARLDQVQVLVLDEADRMLDMGFLPAIKRIVGECTSEHQTLLFSATIDKQVENVAKTMLKDPQKIEVARRGETAQTIEQFIVRISHAAKPSALKAVLDEHGAHRVIVFARTRHRADACSRRLRRAGYKTGVIHSDRSQNQRRRALDAFDKGELNVLVATDVLARGIDIDQVDYVVNYDLPNQAEDYVHRIGRTGRAGAKGFAISLVNPEVEGDLKAIQKLIKRDIPEMELKTLDKESVEADAEARSMQLQARRSKDPEIQAVVKELAKEKSKRRKLEAKHSEEAKPERSKKKNNNRRKSSKKTSTHSQSKGQSHTQAEQRNNRSSNENARNPQPRKSGTKSSKNKRKPQTKNSAAKVKQPKSQIRTYTNQKDASRPRPGRFSSGLR